MLQVNYIQVTIIQPRLILYFLCFLTLIIHELGLGDRKLRIDQGQIKINLKPNVTYNINAPCACLSRSKFHHQTSFVSKILSISTLWWESTISSLLTTLRWEFFFFFCRIS